MYRSLLTLDLLHPSTQRALRDCNDMHRNLMRAFADTDSNSSREANGLLYTIMTANDVPVLYVLSKTLPDWSKVRGVRLYQDKPPLCIDALQERFAVGTRFSFRLFASPTKKVAREGKLSARVFLRDTSERMAWLERHVSASGFRVLNVAEQDQKQVCGSKQGAPIHYTGVTFEGMLEITDADAFWSAYCNGIGPGKAYGLGMLMVGR